jgi:MoaA/NifB/PqqE/SkfB family radical SAM enzyme
MSVVPWVVIAHSEASGLPQSLPGAAQAAADDGAISQAEHDVWVQELNQRIEAGRSAPVSYTSLCTGPWTILCKGRCGVGYSVGIGLTNDCNLSCDHCYRDTEKISALSLQQVKDICEAIPVASMGMGTGENALHPEFIPIVEYLRGKDIRLSIASNGYSLTTVPVHILEAFRDVEVSIDFPTQEEQDEWRGAGNWALVHRSIERCQKLGIEVSILATMMPTNVASMGRLVQLARRSGVNLRVNAYQPVKTDTYRLRYEEFWSGYRRLFAEGLVVACSEPVVRAVMGLEDVHSPCGRSSIRFNPRGQVIPCVYWPADGSPLLNIQDLRKLGVKAVSDGWFRSARETPPSASKCPCQGGCASRRALNGNLDAHDDYCPWVRGKEPELKWKPAPSKDLMRAGNVCTTIVI